MISHNILGSIFQFHHITPDLKGQYPKVSSIDKIYDYDLSFGWMYYGF